jgi:hypothetical protein
MELAASFASATTRLITLFFFGAEARLAETLGALFAAGFDTGFFAAEGRAGALTFFDDPPDFLAGAPPFLAGAFFAEGAFLEDLLGAFFEEDTPPFFDDTFLEDLLDDTGPFFDETFLEEAFFEDETPPFFDDTFLELADFLEGAETFFDADFFEALPLDELPFFAAILFSFCQNSFGGEPYFFELK